MSLKEFCDHLKKIKLIAHKLGYIMTNYPENSIDAIKEIFNNKDLLECCNGFEFDICFTKDNIPILAHDKYIDDISDHTGYIKDYTLDELKKINFSFRKTISNEKNKEYTYKVLPLKEIFQFFKENKKYLGEKIIKIETKEAYKISKKNMTSLAKTIDEFNELKDNLVHLSYWPQNLIILKKIQEKNKFNTIKTDLLCDYKIMIYVAKLLKSIDNISLRIKTNSLPTTNKNNSKRVNRKITIDKLSMKFSNTIDEITIKNIIKKYGNVGLYVLNDENEINILTKKLSSTFIKENINNIIITTDNPKKIKHIN